MVRFVALVVADSEDEIAERVELYSENLQVDPYFHPMSEDDVASMAKYYNIDVSDHDSVLAHIESWTGSEGAYLDNEYGYMSQYNPFSKWDWYAVGGRWADSVPKDQCLAEEVTNYFTEYLPSVIVDNEGWHEAKEFGWFGASEGAEDIVKQKLEQHKGKNVYVVDFHI